MHDPYPQKCFPRLGMLVTGPGPEQIAKYMEAKHFSDKNSFSSYPIRMSKCPILFTQLIDPIMGT